MNGARADALSARQRLADGGWISRRAESFRHLPPPAAAVWLGEAEQAAGCDAGPLEGAGWTLQPIGELPSGRVDARWLDASDSEQRAELFAGLPAGDDDEAAPFAWAHRALCRGGLRLRLDAPEAADADAAPTVWLQLRLRSHCAVDAPLLVVELQPGVRCVLAEVHERDSSHCHRAQVQNLQVHLRLGRGAVLQHLRIATPAADDRLAHHVHVRLAQDARYHQTLLASGSSYHLQRNVFDLQGRDAAAHGASVLFAAGQKLEQQVRTRHEAAQTRSVVEALALAAGAAQVVVNAHTRIAGGADEAAARQRLNGVATGGQPRIVLRPHLEIHHDRVEAAHGATWGALDEEALFYACQRGLQPQAARALMVEGMARAVLSRGLQDVELMDSLGIDALLAAQARSHLGTSEVRHG